MDQQWPLPQKQAGTTPPDGGGRTPGIARYLETGQLQVIPPRRCLTENALSQRLLSQILQTAPCKAASANRVQPRMAGPPSPCRITSRHMPTGPTPPPAPARPPSATRRDCRAVAPRGDDCNDAGAGSWNRPPATRDAAPRAVRTLQAPATGRSGRGEQSTRTSQLHHPEISVVRLKPVYYP